MSSHFTKNFSAPQEELEGVRYYYMLQYSHPPTPNQNRIKFATYLQITSHYKIYHCYLIVLYFHPIVFKNIKFFDNIFLYLEFSNNIFTDNIMGNLSQPSLKVPNSCLHSHSQILNIHLQKTKFFTIFLKLRT